MVWDIIAEIASAPLGTLIVTFLPYLPRHKYHIDCCFLILKLDNISKYYSYIRRLVESKYVEGILG